MPEIIHPEVMSVGTDDVTVFFRTAESVPVVTRVGGREVTTTGPYHLAHVTGLESGAEVGVDVEGAVHGDDPHFPRTVTTLVRPPGRLLATVATANDVHFGETVCGRIHTVPDEELGVAIPRPDEPPYPQTMNNAAIDEMLELDPDLVLVKGDLTCEGTVEEYQQFLDAYGRLGDRMHHVRGNHDAMRDDTMALEGAPYAVERDGVSFVMLDTVRPGTEFGRITAAQIDWLDEYAAAASNPVFVFGHHNLWDLDAEERSASYFGVNCDDSEAFGEVVLRRTNIVGYFAGHTHRHRIRRSERARFIPCVEVGATKDYPGVWAEYRIHEGGFTQVVHRISTQAAMDWTERTRFLYAGMYRDYSLGPLEHRCYTELW